jgi:hypothetical protein
MPPIRTRDCGAFMNQLFVDRIQNKDAVLNRPAAEASGDAVQAVGTPAVAAPLGEPSQSELRRREATATPTPAVATSRGPLWVVMAIAIVIVAGLGVAGYVMLWPKSTVVRVESTPEHARVLLDGEPRGTTPQLLEDVPAGRHEIALELDGYERHQESIVAEGGRLELSRTLTPLATANTIDTTMTDETPVAMDEMPVAMNDEIPAMGTGMVVESPDMSGDADDVVEEGAAVRGTATLNLITIPGGATIYANRRRVGETPISGATIPAGRVSVRIVHPDHPTKTIPLRVRPGETISRRITL